MKKNVWLAGFLLASLFAQAQNKKASIGQIPGLDSKSLQKTSSDAACKCVDSIDRRDKTKAELSKEIGACIDKQVVSYELADKLLGTMDISKEIEKAMNGDTLKKKTKNPKKTEISLNVDENSEEYKQYYYKLERYMMDSCKALQLAINSNEKENENSISGNAKARAFYSAGFKGYGERRF